MHAGMREHSSTLGVTRVRDTCTYLLDEVGGISQPLLRAAQKLLVFCGENVIGKLLLHLRVWSIQADDQQGKCLARNTGIHNVRHFQNGDCSLVRDGFLQGVGQFSVLQHSGVVHGSTEHLMVVRERLLSRRIIMS